MPFPAFVKDRGGMIIACNQRFLAWVGLPAEKVIGFGAATVAPLEPVEIDRASDQAVLETGQSQRFEGQAPRAGAERRDVEIHKSALSDAAGHLFGLLGIVLDVTERKRTERALVESEARFIRLSELTHEGLVIHRAGRILDVNEAICRMTGWSREELVGQGYEVLVDPGSLAEVRRRVSMSSDEPYRANLRRQDGGALPVEIHARNLIRHGADLRAVAIRDLTEQLAAEEAQREREELYRQMFETNSAVKLLIDPDMGRIFDANPAAARFYGWSLEELRSRHITDINALPEEQVKAEMKRAQEESRHFFRFRHRLASGEVRDVEIYSGPVTYHGRPLLHSIIYDVTDRNRYQRELERKTAQLERSNADLEQFAYVASHDLQEPLRTVVSYLQLLERRYRERLEGDALDFIDYAVQGAKRMGKLINGLLEYARVDAQARPFQAVDLNRLLGTVLANLRAALEDAGASVRVGELPVVKGDEGLLSGLFQNLLGTR